MNDQTKINAWVIWFGVIAIVSVITCPVIHATVHPTPHVGVLGVEMTVEDKPTEPCDEIQE